MHAHIFQVQQQTLHLLPERAVYWQEKNWLLLADIHLGKSTHFRKRGIPVPAGVGERTVNRLAALIEKWQPSKVVFLGDLFHSSHNREWAYLAGITARFSDIEFVLVQGNHDVLHKEHYTAAKLMLTDRLTEGPFHFTHYPEANGLYNICGHIHPGVTLSGRGRQSISLPCFHFGKTTGILPAFGDFTGKFDMAIANDDEVFACTPGSIVSVIK